MKIAHVVFDLSVGGMERLIVDLAKRQQSRGDDVAVYCIAQRGALSIELEEAGVPVRSLNKQPGADWRLLWRMIREFRAKRFDVIHTHNNVASLYGAIAGRLARVPMVLNTRHGMADLPYNHRREQIYRLSVAFCHRVVFVCQRAKDFSEEMHLVPPEKGLVVYNGIDMAPFKELPDRGYENVRSEFGLGPDTKIVGTVCRLTEAKDLPTLIAIAGRLRAARANVRFLIVGAGEEEAKLRAQVREQSLEAVVLFTGRRGDVARLLSAFDVFVLTSVSEGMSLALIEASAAARPIVTTDVGGSAEVVLNDRTGFVVPGGRIEEMTQRIGYLLDHPAEGERMGEVGRARARQEFDIERTCASYALVYAQNCALRANGVNAPVVTGTPLS